MRISPDVAPVTRFMKAPALKARKELKVGTTNVNEVPDHRLELTPIRRHRDPGLGVKEGMIEAIKFFTHEKTWLLPLIV